MEQKKIKNLKNLNRVKFEVSKTIALKLPAKHLTDYSEIGSSIVWHWPTSNSEDLSEDSSINTRNSANEDHLR